MPGQVCFPCTCTSDTPAQCGTDSTCNKFCKPELKDFSRGQGCKCPCAGRRGYPPDNDKQFTFGVKTGVKIASVTPADGTFYELVGASSVTWNACDELFEPYTVIHYDTDGTTVLDEADNHIKGFALVASAGGCPLTDPTRLYLTGFAIIDAGFGGIDRAIVGTSDPSFPSTVHGDVDRCTGGTINVTAGGSPFAAGDGTLTVTPKCRNCLGELLQQTGDPSSICAGELDVEVCLWDGADYVSHKITTTGSGGSGYSGENEDGDSVSITLRSSEDGAEKCCPSRDPTNCADCDAPDSGDCESCWTMTIRIGGCTLVFHAQGPCPPTSGWTLVSISGCATPPDPDHIDSIYDCLNMTYGTDCPGSEFEI